MNYLTPARLARLEQRLSERDRQIVTEVHRLRLVSGGQLRRLYFADLDVRSAQRQLRRLRELSVLGVLERRIGGVRAGSDGLVYRLGLAGQRLAANWQRLERRAQRLAEPGVRFVAHTLACSELYVGLVEADRCGDIRLLEHHAEPAAWRSRVGPYGSAVTLRPDGFVDLLVGDWERFFFIEIDQATESLSVVGRKAAAYLSHYQSGVEHVMPRVAWLTPDEARAEQIISTVGRLGGVAADLFVAAPQHQAIELLKGVR